MTQHQNYNKMKCKHILVHRGSYDECEKCGAVRECCVLYGMPCGSKNPAKSIKTKMKEKPVEKIRYKTRPIRMDDRTWEAMRNRKLISGKSWNLFLISLLKKK